MRRSHSTTAAKAKSRGPWAVAGALAVALAVALWALWRTKYRVGQVLARATSREAKMEILRKIDDICMRPSREVAEVTPKSI